MEEEIRFLEFSLSHALRIVREYNHTLKYTSILKAARDALNAVPFDKHGYILRRIVEDLPHDAIDGFYSGDIKKSIQCLDGIAACQLLLEHLLFIRESLDESRTLH